MASDYAMSTKARSLYSQHITAAQYRQMLERKAISEIAFYLKSETRYRGVLEGINEKGIHRGYLEQRVRLIAQQEFLSLMRYIRKDKHHFYEFYVREVEIRQIDYVLHAIDAGSVHYVDDFIQDLEYLMSFNLQKLAACNTYDEVYEVLSHTEYIKPLASLKSNTIDLARCEDNLWQFYHQKMFELISREPDNEELMEVFKMNVELDMVSNVYRMKKSFDVTSDEILERIHYQPHFISRKKIEQWVKTLSAQEILDEVKQTPYGRYEDFEGEHHVEYYFDMIRYNVLRRKMRFSTNSDVILFSYMFLVKIEIENIVDVIEGIRYTLSPEEIVKLLIV